MTSHLDNELKQSGITDSFQNELLEAGKGDELSSDRRHRLVASIGLAVGAPPGLFPDAPSALQPDFPPVTPGVGSAEQVAASNLLQAGTWQAGGLQALLTKVVGVTVLGGASIWGGYALLGSQGASPNRAITTHAADVNLQEQAPAVANVTKREEQTTANGASANGASANDVAPASEAVVDPITDSSELTAKARKAPASDSLTRELAMIETGRAELLRKNPSATLSTLSKYRKEFPKGTLQAEATVLRVEALIASGNRSSAVEVGEAFLRRSPNSPYSRRISSLLGGSHEPATKAGTQKK